VGLRIGLADWACGFGSINPHSIGNPHSALDNQQSALGAPQSAILTARPI